MPELAIQLMVQILEGQIADDYFFDNPLRT